MSIEGIYYEKKISKELEVAFKPNLRYLYTYHVQENITFDLYLAYLV